MQLVVALDRRGLFSYLRFGGMPGEARTGRVFRHSTPPFSHQLGVGIDAVYLPMWLRLPSEGLPYCLDQRSLLTGEDGADIEHQLAVAQPSHDGRRPQTEPPGEFLIAQRSRLDFDDPRFHGLIRQRAAADVSDIFRY